MKLKNYQLTDTDFWKGRVDDLNDIESFRMHQVIHLLDLRKLEIENVEFSKFSICLIGFRSDEGIKRNLGRKGAINGPEYIRKEFSNLPVTFGKSIDLYDAGDIFCIENNMEEAQAQLSIAMKIILDNNMFPIVLGGGHEIAFGHYNGIVNHIEKNEKGKSNIGIINFDAHFDLRPYNDIGSSGTMFSQIADNCALDNRNFSYLCLGIQTSANTISLFKRADKLGVEHILAKDFTEANFENISIKINEFIDKHEHIYTTICSDVFNSAFAPGVSAMQPFGMHPETVLIFLKEIIKSNKVVSLDIAEVSPRFDQDKRTAKLIAVIIYAIINTFVENLEK